MTDPSPGGLEATLRQSRNGGRKLLVPYLTGGFPGWADMVRATADAGADAIEIGIPFSDPVMDGPIIQEASDRALAEGTNPASVLDELSRLDAGVPIAVMTYVNLVYRFGYERFAAQAAASGVSGAILPDLPLEESGEWCEAADRSGVETIMLAAPTAPDERLPRICDRARGFVYGVGLLGVTGERTELAASALDIARRLKAVTDRPVLVGVGVSTPAQAVETCSVADGVVIGSVVVRRMIESGTAAGVGELVATFRQALDTL